MTVAALRMTMAEISSALSAMSPLLLLLRRRF